MHYLLFTTTKCPKCPAFKDMVQKVVKIPGEILNETHESFFELTEKYDISSVPSFFLFSDETRQDILFQTNDAVELYSYFQAHAY